MAATTMRLVWDFYRAVDGAKGLGSCLEYFTEDSQSLYLAGGLRTRLAVVDEGHWSDAEPGSEIEILADEPELSAWDHALMVELEAAGLRAEKEVPIAVAYKGVRVGDYRADIVVENRLILELKAVVALNAAHEAQLVNYLNATGIDDGLLINFGAASLQHKHKYRVYRQQQPLNPVNPVNPV